MRPGPVLLLAGAALAESCCVTPPEPAASASAPLVSPAAGSTPLAAAAPDPSEGAAPALAPTRPAAPVGASPSGVAAAAPAPAEVDSPSTPDEPAPSPEPVELRLDEPYKLYHRPRPPGPVLAAVQDEVLARWNVGGTGAPEFVSNQPHYHPGARVVVDTEVLLGNLPKGRPGRRRGVLTQAGVLARARKYGYWPIRLCFEDGLRRDQSLHGKTVVRLTLAASGKVNATRLVDTDLNQRAVAECLVDEVRDLEFLPPPHRRVDVEMSIRLWPGHAPVPLAGPPDEDFEEPPGQLDVAATRSALEQCSPALRSCYRQGLARDPKLWGRIQLQVDQAPSGRIVKIAQTESRFPDPSVAQCIIAALGALELPKPKGGPLSFVYGVRLGRLPDSG